MENGSIRQRLYNIEARLDRLSAPAQLSFDSLTVPRSDEVDLREIWNILWDRKWWIIGITFLFSLGMAFFALSIPDQYKAEIVLAPAQKEGGMGNLAAQYGGLAAIAGINLGGSQNSDIDQATALAVSRPFLEAFIEKYNVKPQVMAVNRWDQDSNQVVYEKDLFDPVARQWIRDSKSNESLEPSNFETYRSLSDKVSISSDSKSGLIRMSVEHYVPQYAYEWAQLLVQELNRHFQARDMRDANRNIKYLQEKADSTSIGEMQSVFYRMIESQMKTLMLAEVSQDYLLKTVIPASLPEKKSKPNRALICALGVLLGGILSVMLVFVFHLVRQKKVAN